MDSSAPTRRRSPSDQVRLAKVHTVILSSTGSSAHNVLFTLHRPRLHLLTGGDSNSTSCLTRSALVGALMAFACLDTGARLPTSYRWWLPEVVATLKLVDHLDGIGLL